ncbi:hypothetical protein [Phreatobacter cathodiphilus]|uniref:Uncharacterized protein n=1 Tax=Phreatobacter cathodiphilus TaxID=1868589 RepID=A0A2S0NBA2_9HYPH|nr:hypothetical protein [Phreatobacter cathodiphilus]AVO45430.1 hypothetical protein C6569_10355 [Phreatobacter cathodiphilus]
MRSSTRRPIPDAPAEAAGDTFQLLRAGFLAVFATVVLASCAYVPVAVEGVATRPDIAARDAENPWIFVPAGAWITRDTVTPVSVGACPTPACPERVAIAVVEARGPEARTLARTLRQPGPLVTRLAEGNRRRIALVTAAQRNVPAAVAARRIPHRVASRSRPFQHRAFTGFRLEMRRETGPARTAHAAVLGRRQGDTVKVVVVIGETAAQAEATARTVADANL